MNETQRQRASVVLAEAIDILRTIDPYLDVWNCERSILARHLIQWVLRELDKIKESQA